MHTLSREIARRNALLAPRREFTNRVHFLLMVGGTVVMLLAVLSNMQPRLTCAASLWLVAGFYGLVQLLRTDPRAAGSSLDDWDDQDEGERVDG